uniref:Uncharacterized protein n=1 Tax=Myoviridae sp. ct1ba2 TaxID=2827654 RepID=A0A8S5S690_9CAUD|nr:MAG TPA: hypothetical protein [Myoviridae sp. ct1ba2]
MCNLCVIYKIIPVKTLVLNDICLYLQFYK